jgi:hypothetical protein
MYVYIYIYIYIHIHIGVKRQKRGTIRWARNEDQVNMRIYIRKCTFVFIYIYIFM